MSYLHGSPEETSFSDTEIREMFKNTAIKIGLDETTAGYFGQSVWHLCNRGIDGIIYSITFLMLNKTSLSEIWQNPKYPYADDPEFNLCPFRTAQIIIQHIRRAETSDALDDFSLMIARPAAPLLCLPMLANILENSAIKYKTVQVSGPTASIAMSSEGMLEIADTMSHELKWLGTQGKETVPIQFKLLDKLDPQGVNYIPKSRHTTLWVPTSRVNPDGTLNLD
jgi:hypothetical protein